MPPLIASGGIRRFVVVPVGTSSNVCGNTPSHVQVTGSARRGGTGVDKNPPHERSGHGVVRHWPDFFMPSAANASRHASINSGRATGSRVMAHAVDACCGHVAAAPLPS